MSGQHSDWTWQTVNQAEDLTVTMLDRAPAAVVRQISPRGRPVRCPSCQTIVYTRRHRLCAVCSEPLPHELLFTIAEADRIEGLLREERDRHKKWMERHGASHDGTPL